MGRILHTSTKQWVQVVKQVSIGVQAAHKHYHRVGPQDLRLQLARLKKLIASDARKTNTVKVINSTKLCTQTGTTYYRNNINSK